MRLSDNGRTLIKEFEGLSLKAYPDADGYSIGYGHFLGKDPSLKSRVITRAEADRLFDVDAVKFETAVSMTTPRALQHEFDAMTCLTYNIGAAGFAGSTVARLHNMGDRMGAADAFLLWNKAKDASGVRGVHPGLVKRRAKERSVYLNGYSPTGTFPEPTPQQTPSSSAEPVATAPVLPEPPSPWSLVPPQPTSAAHAASLGSIAAIAFGWLLYRLMSR